MYDRGWECRLEVSGHTRNILALNSILGVKPYHCHVKGTPLTPTEKRVAAVAKEIHADARSTSTSSWDVSTWSYRVVGQPAVAGKAMLDLIEPRRKGLKAMLRRERLEARMTLMVFCHTFDVSAILPPELLKRFARLGFPVLVQIYVGEMTAFSKVLESRLRKAFRSKT